MTLIVLRMNESAEIYTERGMRGISYIEIAFHFARLHFLSVAVAVL